MSTFLADMLRAAREEAGYTVAGMARRTGYSKSHLCNLECGRRSIEREHMQAYLDVLRESEETMERRQLLATLTKLTAVAPATLIAEHIRQSLMNDLGIKEWPELVEFYGRYFLHGDPATFHNRLTGDLIQLRAAKADTAEWMATAARLFTLYAADAEENARRWYASALLAAQRSGDVKLAAWVCGRQVFRSVYADAYDGAWIMGQARNAPSAEARLAEAQVLARAGERTRALKCLNEARRQVDATVNDEITIYEVSPWRLNINAGFIYALIGDVRNCETALCQAVVPAHLSKWEVEKDMVRAVALRYSGEPQARTLAEQAWGAAHEDIKTMVSRRFYREATR